MIIVRYVYIVFRGKKKKTLQEKPSQEKRYKSIVFQKTCIPQKKNLPNPPTPHQKKTRRITQYNNLKKDEANNILTVVREEIVKEDTNIKQTCVTTH